MRRKINLFFFILCACVFFTASALANAWGLPAALLGLFEKSPGYEGYYLGAGDEQTHRNRPSGTAMFQMTSQNHNELFIAEERKHNWEITARSTKALYQPQHEKAQECTIVKIAENSFTLAYPDESYTFTQGQREEEEGRWVLVEAAYNGGEKRITLPPNSYFYYYHQGGESLLWQQLPISLDDFNLTLMPKSAQEVKGLNTLSQLTPAEGFLTTAPVEAKNKKALLPVYTAPSTSAYRAGEGKAAMSIKDEFWTLGKENTSWALVAYQISNRAARVGYVKSPAVVQEAYDMTLSNRPVSSLSDTFITDDPILSQRILASVAPGSPLYLLGSYGPFYAYVQTQFEGKTIRGFVPGVSLNYNGLTAADIPPQLVGIWKLEAGGTMYAEVIHLYANGTCEGYYHADGNEEKLDLVRKGRWHVEPYDTAYNLYWNNPKQMIVFNDDDGIVDAYGLDY